MLQTPASFTPLMAPPPESQSGDVLSFIFHGGRLLVREAGLSLPGREAVAGLELDPQALQPVGLLDGRYCQAGWVEDESRAPPGYAWRGLRSLFGELDEEVLGVAGRAAQVAEWARTHRFCGACGSGTARLAGERCFKCLNCGHMAYPRISPAMMVLIRKGDSVLLALHTQPAVKRFVPLAGFLEAGESVEEAVHREVFEEVGLRVHNLRYFGSQSWPFPHSLMIAFTADYLDGEISVSSVLVDAHRPAGR
jgi:NAD+ diphosphatase